MAEGSEQADAQENEPKAGRPGPVDHGHDGGMATRENAPELSKPNDEDSGA